MSVMVEVEFVTIECFECGMLYCVTKEWLKYSRQGQKRRDGFWCPNGHNQVWTGKSEVEKVQDQLAAQKRRSEYLEADLQRSRRLRQSVENSLRATKGVVTKIKKRVGHGVCPCCNRTFKQLARHMEAKHPEFVGSEVTR